MLKILFVLFISNVCFGASISMPLRDVEYMKSSPEVFEIEVTEIIQMKASRPEGCGNEAYKGVVTKKLNSVQPLGKKLLFTDSDGLFVTTKGQRKLIVSLRERTWDRLHECFNGIISYEGAFMPDWTNYGFFDLYDSAGGMRFITASCGHVLFQDRFSVITRSTNKESDGNQSLCKLMQGDYKDLLETLSQMVTRRSNQSGDLQLLVK